MTKNTRPQAYQPRLTDDQWNEAKDRYLKGESASSIAEDFKCKRQLLDTRFCRAGLPKVRDVMLKQGRGGRTKDKVAEVAENVLDVLRSNTPKSLELLNVHADTALKAAKMGQIAHDWGAGVHLAIIQPGMFQGQSPSEDQAEVIDVESSESGT